MAIFSARVNSNRVNRLVRNKKKWRPNVGTYLYFPLRPPSSLFARIEIRDRTPNGTELDFHLAGGSKVRRIRAEIGRDVNRDHIDQRERLFSRARPVQGNRGTKISTWLKVAGSRLFMRGIAET